MTSSPVTYSIGEEIANSITHGIGLALSIAGLTLLLTLAILFGSPAQIIAFSIYGGSLILLYLASTLYHSLPQPRLKSVLKILDHAAIYWLIAGTYTPFLLIAIPGTMARIMLVVLWGLALLGTILKLFFMQRIKWFSTSAYVAMGWLGVLMANDVLANVPLGGVYWLIAGGLLYTGGVVFYAMKQIRYSHAIWHVFVLGGSICHFAAVLLYLTPNI